MANGPPPDLLVALIRELSRFGSLSRRYEEIVRTAAGAFEWTAITFEGTIPATAAITQPSPVQLPVDYDFWWYKMRGYHDEPGSGLGDTRRVTFNVTFNRKRMFLNDFNLAALVTTIGPGPDLDVYPGGRRLTKDGQVEVAYTRGTGWVGGTRVVGVVLVGELIYVGTGKK